MHMSHELLQAAKTGSLTNLLGLRTVTQFLGAQWVDAHPKVRSYIQELEALAVRESNAPPRQTIT